MLLAALRPTAPRCATSAANRKIPAALTKNRNANRLQLLSPENAGAAKCLPLPTKGLLADTKKRGVYPEGYTPQ